MNKKKYIIGIETSCDDTSISIFFENNLIGELTISSINEQRKYGGVVPELASRYHLKHIHKIFLNLLKEKSISVLEIKSIVYTKYPGLIGSLHVGILFSEMLAKLLKIPAYGVDHIAGHIFSPFIGQQKNKIDFPFVSLIVSGGTSAIYLVNSFNDYKIINQSTDDSVGEVYDKVARALDWQYPGGPIIDKMYDSKKNDILFIKKRPLNSNLSFSGLKTAVLNYINTKKMKNIDIDKIHIASSFQKTIIFEIIEKLKYYLQKNNINNLAIGGGVSANSLLRSECLLICKQLYYPDMKFTGDNATMIAYYGYLMYN